MGDAALLLPEPSRRPAAPNTPVLLNYGLGVDSTAILARWLRDPETRDFPLEDLVVVTAMTGDEWQSTASAVADHILPLLALHHVRYVQLARGSYYRADGVVVLDDSREPQRLHIDGAYRLSEELLSNATVPMSAAKMRRCSAKQKGAVIDASLPLLVPCRAAFRNVVGYALGEERRACGGQTYDHPGRTSEYPLIAWGWDRERRSPTSGNSSVSLGTSPPASNARLHFTGPRARTMISSLATSQSLTARCAPCRSNTAPAA
ncbi:MAG: hypothetical protein M0014_15615 [Actinomycetota bacterium]|jgi:hypothetical protein|nr:hypothetical protein [Actinomycetota bacterium]